MGGIERVVLEQLRIFAAHGSGVELLLDREPRLMRSKLGCPWFVLAANAEERRQQLQTYLKASRPDMLIFHGVSHKYGYQDAQVAADNGIKNVCVIHFPFAASIALEGGECNSWKLFHNSGSPCTAFATVSAIDALFWRALGKKAFHVQNPFVHPSKNVETIRRTGEDGAANLLWVGRLCEQKQPKSALAAFALALKDCPNIKLTMVGGDSSGIKALEKEAHRLGIYNKVKFVPEHPNIDEYWEKADIHLLTSICESFCLVWAEAKAAGIPTVMFELPYLELAYDARGYIAVEQKNTAALANAIIELARDSKKRLEMGRDAKDSLAPFNDEAVWQSWMSLFDGLDDPIAGMEVDSNLKTIVTQTYAAVCHDKETHRWPEEMADDWQRVFRCSMRPFSKWLVRLLLFMRKVKTALHG